MKSNSISAILKAFIQRIHRLDLLLRNPTPKAPRSRPVIQALLALLQVEVLLLLLPVEVLFPVEGHLQDQQTTAILE
jgi:hypothetical protein